MLPFFSRASQTMPLLFYVLVITPVSPAEGLWKLLQFWLINPRVEMPYHSELLDFWNRQDASVFFHVTWVAFKVFSRDSLLAIIRRVNMEMGADIAAAEVRASTLEATYMQTQDIQVYQSLQLALCKEAH